MKEEKGPINVIAQDDDYEDIDLPDDLQQRLNLVQAIRLKVVSGITRGGKVVPRTEEELKMLQSYLKDFTSDTIGEMRVKVDSDNKSNESLVAATLLEMQRIRTLTGTAYTSPAIEHQCADRKALPTPELELPVELVPDETFIGQQSLTYDDFKERFDKK